MSNVNSQNTNPNFAGTTPFPGNPAPGPSPATSWGSSPVNYNTYSGAGVFGSPIQGFGYSPSAPFNGFPTGGFNPFWNATNFGFQPGFTPGFSGFGFATPFAYAGTPFNSFGQPFSFGGFNGYGSPTPGFTYGTPSIPFGYGISPLNFSTPVNPAAFGWSTPFNSFSGYSPLNAWTNQGYFGGYATPAWNSATGPWWNTITPTQAYPRTTIPFPGNSYATERTVVGQSYVTREAA